MLLSMGLSKVESEHCIRFSLGKQTQMEEVQALTELILNLYGLKLVIKPT